MESIITSATAPQLVSSFRHFLWEYNLVANISGFGIGIATKEFIEKIIIKTIAHSLWTYAESRGFFGLSPKTADLIGDFLLWIAITIATFLIATVVFKRLVGEKAPPQKEISGVSTKF